MRRVITQGISIIEAMLAIHVTTAPGESVIERCRDNLDAGCKPLVTIRKGVAVAEGLAENQGLG